MGPNAWILEHWIVLRLRVQNVLHGTLNRLVHFRQWAVFGDVGDIAGNLRVLWVRVLIDRRKQTSNTFRIQMECALAVWRAWSIGRDGNIRDVMTGPAFGPFVPPHDRQRSWIGLAVFITGCAVVENAHVVRPGPAEIRIKPEISRIGPRVPAFGKIDSATKNSGINPGPGRSRAKIGRAHV